MLESVSIMANLCLGTRDRIFGIGVAGGERELCILSWIRVSRFVVGTDLDAVTHVSYAFNVNGEYLDKEI